MVSKVISNPDYVVSQKNDTPARAGHRIHQILKDDLIGYSFHFLQLREIAACMTVCKYFNSISKDPLLWQQVSTRYGAQYVENQSLISLTKKAVVDIQSFNRYFLAPFASLQIPISQSQNQDIRTAHQRVIVAVEKKQDVLKVKEALINFYSVCCDAGADVLGIHDICVGTITNFCSGKDSLQILIKSQMRFDAGHLLMGLARNGNTASVDLLLSTPDLNFASQNLAPRYNVNMAQSLTRNEEIRALIQNYIDQHFMEEEEPPHFVGIVPPAAGAGVNVAMIAQNAPAVVQAPPAAIPAPVVQAVAQFVPMEIAEEQTLQDN